ncbi:MAG: hypothetical protein V3U72_02835 [Candidatus Aenigmarchaeota archaeon]
MKGFIHVVEILLVVLLVFFVFAQFASIPRVSDDWAKIKLGLTGDDVLKALERKGVDWFNRTELGDELNQTLPGNIIYSVLLENVIKPEIEIGCLCDNEDFQIVEKIFEDESFIMNGAEVEFEITQVTDKDSLFSLDYDVALIYGYEDFSPNVLLLSFLTR